MMFKILPICLFLLLLVTIAPTYNAVTSIIVTGCLLVILATICKNKEIKKYSIPKNIYYAFCIFISGIMISSIAIHDIKYIKECVKIFYWMMPFFMIYILCLSIESQKVEKIALYAFNIGLFITSVPAIYKFLETHKRVSGLYGNPNHFASMLDLILPFSIILAIYFAKKYQKKYIVILMIANICFGLAGLYFSGSRGAILGTIIGFIIVICTYILKEKPINKIVKIVVLLMLLLGVTVYGTSNMIEQKFSRSYDNERIYLLKSTYAMWNDNKIFGVGLVNWADNYQKKYILPEAKETRLDIPHNIYGYYFSTTGIIGGISFIAMLCIISIFLVKAMEVYTFGGFCAVAMFWALLAISIHGFVDVGLTLKFASRLFYCCLGLTIAEIVKIAREREKHV